MPVLSPPPAVKNAVTEVIHGVPVVDSYRWLEFQDSEQTRKWIAEQTAYTKSYFEELLPVRAPIRSQVEQLLAVAAYRDPHGAGDRCFFLKREAYQEQPVLAMREGESGEDTVLLDPVQMTGSPQAAIDILAISPNGRLLAFSVRTGGEDCAPIGFLDVDTRQVLGERLPAGTCGGLVFSEDRRGVYYIHRELNSPRPCYQAVFFHELGSAFAEDAEIFFLGERANLRLMIAANCGLRTLLYRAAALEDPMRSDFYIHDAVAGQAPRKILENIEGMFCPFFVANRFFAFTDFQAPNGRIVEIDLEASDPAAWRTVVPEANSPVVDFSVAGGSLYVVRLQDLAHQILIYDLNGRSLGEVPTPATGSVQLCHQQGPTDALFFRFSSFDHPPALYCVQGRDSVREWPKATQLSGHRSTLDVRRVRYPAKDGTLIPMFLVSRQDAGHNGPRPVFLTAYGGFGVSITPQFTAYATILMELGCVFAVANVRGGAEFGKQWHEAAKRRNRQTAIDDFLSAADWLLAGQIAEPGKIAIGGGSNAGLLVGAALTQRPDLFRAVLCLGPLLDMLRYHKFDVATMWIDEYGTSDAPDDFQALYRYSPYHRIQDNVAYPAVMFISGDADTRCNPMHTRKMAARLQAANISRHPILLDYKTAWGHVPVQPLTTRIDALTDRLLFLCNELGLTIPGAWS